jgi:hypothetical protein
VKKAIEELAKETDEVLPNWEIGTSMHPLALLILKVNSFEDAIEELEEVKSQCNHTIGWIMSKMQRLNLHRRPK